MPPAFSGIYMASNALRSFEYALNVTGHNLANINTPGYSRQTIDIQSTPELTMYGLRPFKMGTGAYVQSVNRVKDMFLQGRFLQTATESARLGQMSSALRGIEAILGEGGPDSISNSLDSLFNAWSQLSANPNDNAARMNIRLHAESFVSRIRSTHSNMLSMRTQLSQQTVGTIEEINRLAGRISDLNEQVRIARATGGTPNDLLDRRDQLVEDLSRLANVRTQELGDGSITVFLDQHTLVNQVTAMPLPTDFDPATGTLTDGVRSIRVAGGQLGGLLSGINALDTYKAQLDDLVNEVRTQMNTLHASGATAGGATGIDFFSGANGAGDLDLDPLIRADLNNIVSSVSGKPGDGSLAAAIAELRNTELAALGDRSPIQFYNDLVGRLAQDTFYYANALETQDSILLQLDEQRRAISGVNVDEELANMLRFQRSFQAAAKLLSVLDQTTEELIKSFGR